MWSPLLIGLLSSAQTVPSPPLPVVVVRADDTVLDRSCRVVIPQGQVIADANGDGVIQIRTPGIRIEFAADSVLRGATTGTPGDQLHGVGIRVDGVEGVSLVGARIEGFRCGILAQRSDHLLIDGAVVQKNFRQHLGSTPEAEDGGDWLWPHDNDQQQWRRNYGAGIAVEESQGVVIRGVVARQQQNGILLDRVVDAKVYDNDCSFLSGWGLAMWRSSRNLISRNAFDFCIRGYSHGVYNRGQDSAGILAFEQCNENIFVENSVTHGGDGFFGFAGREALGETEGVDPERSRRRGNNDNVFLRNDFSFAAAHGLELTFSFGNVIRGNRFSHNAICGIWGGFSQDSWILGNEFIANGDQGYGFERGGINIDHSRHNRILGNQFRNNHCGVHLWALPTSFADKPWGRANSLDAVGNMLADNRFENDVVGVHLRGEVELDQVSNEWVGVDEALRLEGEAKSREARQRPAEPIASDPLLVPVLGGQRPVGARADLAGRDQIVMTEWGPWDHRAPFLQRLAGTQRFRVQPHGARIEWPDGEPPHSDSWRIKLEESADGFQELHLIPMRFGQLQIAFEVSIQGERIPVAASLLHTRWQVAVFPTPFDPREDEAAWLAASEGADTCQVEMKELRLPYASGGPQDLAPFQGQASLPGNDHFGTRASTKVPLPAGKWRLRTLSDDGIRVWVDDALVIDNWTWHGPEEDGAEFVLDAARTVALEVHHFELDGYSVLELELERAD